LKLNSDNCKISAPDNSNQLHRVRTDFVLQKEILELY